MITEKIFELIDGTNSLSKDQLKRKIKRILSEFDQINSL